ncbi:2-succinyl-5-enolpyruvyl-6-hydroxy-3-cyclohexene-1-carboxylic-acid synthase [Sporolactobacillus terrae]|uniref:2-succinyl-5-enolpyruvyl-6-hydroxy-3-cyclohexene-1-carboxylate synthase n=1 Tax=Sporolactobacillus terrae TaxID=269673 RepID=A0ABX5Q7A9_9BACL|nr:2-succinyl-5-enolpyruvyl-6-hydroxy-3-cyclohexene-1-carboxylic-acid synthase [Sporolactobacillus terrae]QAA22512.1 2-succinyl-5-enolpyruvyl-6-hydroxy-3-cyclohexene-1-carboxylic-acid synthase [Sporolactobacillus terrae]QAA25486.1 2-succinyl-5-enolpyruvyl-6-hydroxy-3-cyclohexene-1-carboxylic-acid synthase [Sporolactobacillus terrae]UAK17298.1 2-succinyl-5-enolpyruvyl-6-hydroxy-3-cyclohexene-1-carboxylic-acid synthase [Sporolactobacillus terrae]
MNHRDLLTNYLSSFIQTLYEHDVRHVVISPGSRSTPLSMLFDAHPDFTTHLDIDERSAAFLALGIAKASAKPVALVCTSGTAAANYYPAIIEASLARVPLIVITADRPYELQHVAAPQTIDQTEMYGRHVKQFFQLELSEHDLSLLHYNQALASRAAACAIRTPQGPVHINVPLREPLVPNLLIHKFDNAHDAMAAPSVTQGTRSLTVNQLQELAARINAAQRGIILCGALAREARSSILALARHAGFPILADPLSQLRRGAHEQKLVIENYDLFLRCREIASCFKPDLIIRFGAPPVSKSVKLWMEDQECANLVIDAGADWRDPACKATHMVYCDEQYFCEHMRSQINRHVNAAWAGLWQTINALARSTLQSIRDEPMLSEEKLFLKLCEQLPEQADLVVGNSMPIRELDTFMFKRSTPVHVFANRGANGIDGVVSTAVGVALSKGRAILVIGDLSFFHSMNGLLAAKQNHANLTIVLVNNDGGGIFSFLPQASEETYFESLFGTPHGLDFSHAAMLFGAHYTKIVDWPMFDAAFRKAIKEEGITILEVPTKRRDNVQKHQALRSRLVKRFKEANSVED